MPLADEIRSITEQAKLEEQSAKEKKWAEDRKAEAAETVAMNERALADFPKVKEKILEAAKSGLTWATYSISYWSDEIRSADYKLARALITLLQEEEFTADYHVRSIALDPLFYHTVYDLDLNISWKTKATHET